MIDDIVAFIREQLDEDERHVMAVLSDYASHELLWFEQCTGVVQLGDEMLPTGDGPLARHIALHDPARVLGGVDVKRRLLDGLWFAGSVAEVRDENGIVIAGAADAVNSALCVLAAEWSGHPDYQQEWAL